MLKQIEAKNACEKSKMQKGIEWMDKRATIELAVFDWAGTTTDYGSQAPIQVFDQTFSKKGLSFTREEINAPMGMEKRAHIRAMLSTERGTKRWEDAYGRMWNEEDVEELYQSFEQTLSEVVAEHSQLIPGVAESIAQLRKMGIKIGSTTGYTSEMMQYVLPVAKEGGYDPDCVITPDMTGHSRPSPFMVYECMRRMNVYPASRVVKVGDTVMDILEGKNAGAWTIGILVGSNLIGLSEQEYCNTSKDELEQLKKSASKRYADAGADLVIDSIKELPEAICTLNSRLAEMGEVAVH